MSIKISNHSSSNYNGINAKISNVNCEANRVLIISSLIDGKIGFRMMSVLKTIDVTETNVPILGEAEIISSVKNLKILFDECGGDLRWHISMFGAAIFQVEEERGNQNAKLVGVIQSNNLAINLYAAINNDIFNDEYSEILFGMNY